MADEARDVSCRELIYSFGFIVTLEMMIRILNIVNKPSNCFQKESQDLANVQILLTSTQARLLEMRGEDEYNELYEECLEIAEGLEIEEEIFRFERRRCRRCHFVEQEPKDFFKFDLWYSVIDCFFRSTSLAFQ